MLRLIRHAGRRESRVIIATLNERGAIRFQQRHCISLRRPPRLARNNYLPQRSGFASIARLATHSWSPESCLASRAMGEAAPMVVERNQLQSPRSLSCRQFVDTDRIRRYSAEPVGEDVGQGQSFFSTNRPRLSPRRSAKMSDRSQLSQLESLFSYKLNGPSAARPKPSRTPPRARSAGRSASSPQSSEG